jgi:hypothetical protein
MFENQSLQDFMKFFEMKLKDVVYALRRKVEAFKLRKGPENPNPGADLQRVQR